MTEAENKLIDQVAECEKAYSEFEKRKRREGVVLNFYAWEVWKGAWMARGDVMPPKCLRCGDPIKVGLCENCTTEAAFPTVQAHGVPSRLQVMAALESSRPGLIEMTNAMMNLLSHATQSQGLVHEAVSVDRWVNAWVHEGEIDEDGMRREADGAWVKFSDVAHLLAHATREQSEVSSDLWNASESVLDAMKRRCAGYPIGYENETNRIETLERVLTELRPVLNRSTPPPVAQDVRGFTSEEAESYRESLRKIGTPTGATIFERPVAQDVREAVVIIRDLIKAGSEVPGKTTEAHIGAMVRGERFLAALSGEVKP